MNTFRAGVRCRASAELYLTANAGRCDCGTAGRGCGLLRVLWRIALRVMRYVVQIEPEGRSAAPGNADRYGVGC